MIVQNVRQIATDFNLLDRIERAISFDNKLSNIWTVPVEWNFNLRNRAGNANASRIHLHPGLQAASRAEFVDTFLHELAHVCEYTLYGRGGHSQNWWEAMIRLGAKPWETRYHNIDSCMKAAAQTPGLARQVTGSTLEELGL